MKTSLSLAFAFFALPALADSAPAATPVPADSGPAAAEKPAAGDAPDFFVKARSTGTDPLPEPPPYVRQLDKTGLPFVEDAHPDLFRDLSWLDAGLEHRVRWEHRDNDLRQPRQETDDPVLSRTRAYLGIKDILGPLRFAVEVQDSRRWNSGFSRASDTSVRDINEWDFVQAFAELNFKDFAGTGTPVRAQVGRIAFEELDRRLVARNEWRNTTNNFDGVRAVVGGQKDAWQVDAFSLQPVARSREYLDRGNENVWFHGAVAHLRQWSKVVTLEPAYFLLDRDRDGATTPRRVHTAYLRGYGDVGKTGLDYDLTGAYQFGEAAYDKTGRAGDHRALLATAEVGYRLQDAQKTRFSLFGGYASGDKSPTDRENDRFERLFGFARPWSSNDYITPENVIDAKARFETQPHGKVRLDGGYSAYWLASDTDSFVNANLRDQSGRSGSFLGHEFDLRARVALDKRVDLNVGGAWFIPEGFTERQGKGKDSLFFYTEITLRLL